MKTLAACHAAGILAKDIDLLDYDPRRITDWVFGEMMKQ